MSWAHREASVAQTIIMDLPSNLQMVSDPWYHCWTWSWPGPWPAGWHPSMTSDLAHHYKHLQQCGLSVQPVPGSHTQWPGSFIYSIYRGFHVEYQTCFLEAMWDFDLSEWYSNVRKWQYRYKSSSAGCCICNIQLSHNINVVPITGPYNTAPQQCWVFPASEKENWTSSSP